MSPPLDCPSVEHFEELTLQTEKSLPFGPLQSSVMLHKNPNGEDLQSKALCSLIFFLETTII
jgi:hypothetical protein